MVTPVIANPFRREVIVDVGDRYEKGFIWFAPVPHFRPAGYGVDVNRHVPAGRNCRKNAALCRLPALVALSLFRRRTDRRPARACI